MSLTREKAVSSATMNLLNFGMTPQKMIDIPQNELEEMIKIVRFYRNKAKYIKQASEMLLNKYDGCLYDLRLGVLPRTQRELMKFPGIGPITSLMIEQFIYDKATGLPMDSHVLRVSSRIGWVSAKSPTSAQKELESWLPKEKWRDLYVLLLGYGEGI
jgi:endonuclease III